MAGQDDRALNHHTVAKHPARASEPRKGGAEPRETKAAGSDPPGNEHRHAPRDRGRGLVRAGPPDVEPGHHGYEEVHAQDRVEEAADLRLNPHLHIIALDGAWHEDGGDLAGGARTSQDQ